MIIYKVTNKINNKCYIGQTIRSLEQRKHEHSRDIKKFNIVFYRSIKKYGWNSFEWKVLEKCDTKEELDEMEFHYIKQYNTFIPNGYNMTWGGDGGNCGNQFTKLSKKERSKIHFLNLMSENEKEEYLNNLYRGSNHYTKRCMDKKTFNEWLLKNRIGKNNPMYGKNRNFSEITKKRMSISHFDKKHTEETKKKIGESNIGENNGMAKTFKIYKNDGTYEIIKGLYNYCRKKNTTPYKLRKIYKVVEINGGD